jgi:predicted protein tyrosine phosphatase
MIKPAGESDTMGKHIFLRLSHIVMTTNFYDSKNFREAKMPESKTAPSWEDESRIGNASNQYQGNYKRVLCVCAGGLLRSPTTALVLGQEPYNYNTRSAGVVGEYALVKVDTVLLSWCDEIVCMEQEHVRPIEEMLKNVLGGKDKKIIVLDIPDQFAYRDPQLVELVKRRYAEKTADQ